MTLMLESFCLKPLKSMLSHPFGWIVLSQASEWDLLFFICPPEVMNNLCEGHLKSHPEILKLLKHRSEAPQIRFSLHTNDKYCFV